MDQNEVSEFAARLKAGQVLMSPFLKKLYSCLIELSPNEFSQLEVDGDDIYICVSNQWLRIKVKYRDIHDLSNLLYEELHKQYEQLISGTSYAPSVLVSDEFGCFSSSKFTHEQFLLLLRCSLVILKFLEFNLFLVFEKCQILSAMLRKLCISDTLLQSPRQSTHQVAVTMLETCINEFLMHHDVLMHFVMADCASTTNDKLFLTNCKFGEVHAVMELVSTHFILSYHDKVTLEIFLLSLSWSDITDNQIPAIMFDSALALLSFQVISSAPHFLKAHLIILASRCIGIHNSNKIDRLDMNHYTLAFELSIHLYSEFISKLNYFDTMLRDKREMNFGADRLSFDSCIRSLTCDKLRQHIHMLNDLCPLSTHRLFFKNRADILENVITYIKGNQALIDENFRDEACSVLTCIVKSLLPTESKLLREDWKGIEEELYCVAATLKLMSSSLLQILFFLRQDGCTGGTKTSELSEYDFILNIISSFGSYGQNQHIQEMIFGTVESNSSMHTDIKLMFSHFASLLSYSFRNKVDFLWKGCIFMMIPLMNLIIIHEGNLDAFRHLVWKAGHTSSQIFKTNSLKDYVHKPSTRTICSNLLKVRNQIKHWQHEDHRIESSNGIANASNTITEKSNTCTGESYLKCLPDFHRTPSDFDDLVDFIESTPGKDYSTWRENRVKYGKWKYKRNLSMKLKAKRRR